RGAAAADPLALRALRRVRLLADSRLLDRLVRGQLWIPLVAAGLMGIVFMQVTMLKFNAGIGRAVQTASTLERQNANLRSDVSRMESGDRIDSVAHGLGMVVPADGGEHYVRAGTADTAARAAQAMTAPDPQAMARAQAATASATAAAGGPAAATTAAAQPPVQQQSVQTATSAPAAAPTGTTAAQTPAAPAQTAAQQQAAAPVQQQQQAQTPAGATAAPQPVALSPSATTAAATAGGAAAPTGN
ncbi:MAG: hypothetical protein JWQ20_311, partial [Conexibacter sp.]|nr:hypothetical protein [Conexibacter sp.]